MVFPLIAGVLSAAVIGMAKEGHMAAWTGWWKMLTHPAESKRSDDMFKGTLFDQINYCRIASKCAPLKIDPELEKYLERYAQDVPCDDLDEVAQGVQTSLPRYYKVSACIATRPTSDDLLHELQPFCQKTPLEMTHFACMMKAATGGLSETCLVVLGRRLDDFTPEVVNEARSDAFFSICPHCKHPHVCRVSSQQHSMTLECPACSRTYAVIAADLQGKFRYVNEFLTGYHPPARFPNDQSQVEKLFTIWGAVHRHCTYKLDPETTTSQSDAWQTAMETENLQHGDCEDSAIFLADWLESAGFQVRVALGRYGDLGGHAWCVVRLDGNDYLLESTEGRPDPSNPPLADIVGSRYVPEVEFDRKAIYVRTKPKQSWGGDYWSSKVWTRIEPRNPMATAARKGGTTPQMITLSPNVREATRVLGGRSDITVIQSPHPAVAPFADLAHIPAGPQWQVKSLELQQPGHE